MFRKDPVKTVQGLDRVVFGKPFLRTYARLAQCKKTQGNRQKFLRGLDFPFGRSTQTYPSRVLKAWLAHRFTRDILINPVPPWPIAR